jgi:hypothetical protein
MTTRRLTAFLFAALAVVALLASLTGCGGGEEGLTKAQFIRQGDAICRQAEAEQVELAAHYKKKEIAPGHFEPVTSVIVPPMEKELRRLKGLSPPQDDETKVRAILEGIESGVFDAQHDYLDVFYEGNDPFAEANELARKFGFHACAESSHAVIKPQAP